MAEIVTPAGDDLYEADFFVWTVETGRRLRRLTARKGIGEDEGLTRLDLERVAEEIESLGRSERDAVRSQVRRIIERMLMLEHALSDAPKPGWRRSVVEARAVLDDKLSPSLRRDLEKVLPRLYEAGHELAAIGLEEHGETEAVARLPANCPYRLDSLLRGGWYPIRFDSNN